MGESALFIMAALIFVSLAGYVVVWLLFPEWVGMSGKPQKDPSDNDNPPSDKG